MSIESWTALIISICTIVAFVAGSIKWLTKHYFDEIKLEFKPNGGSSMKDAISRLENDVSLLKDHMIKEENEQDQLNKKIDQMYMILLDYISNKK